MIRAFHRVWQIPNNAFKIRNSCLGWHIFYVNILQVLDSPSISEKTWSKESRNLRFSSLVKLKIFRGAIIWNRNQILKSVIKELLFSRRFYCLLKYFTFKKVKMLPIVIFLPGDWYLYEYFDHKTKIIPWLRVYI